MRRDKLFSILFATFLAGGFCFAQDQGNETNSRNLNSDQLKGAGFNFVTITDEELNKPGFTLGPGMELTTINGAHVIAPKGTIVEDKGSWLKVEDTGSYLGRRFDAIEKRFDRIEQNQNELKNQLEQLKQSLESSGKRTLSSK